MRRSIWLPLLIAILVAAGSGLLAPAGSVGAQEPPRDRRPPIIQGLPVPEEFVVFVQPGTNPGSLAARYGATNLGPVAYLPNVYRFRRTTGQAQVMAAIAADPLVLLVEPLYPIQHYKDVDPTDPQFVNQWHLRNTGQAGGVAGNDINVTPVWDAGHTGSGVIVGVIDDGYDYTVPDLMSAGGDNKYRSDLSRNFFSGQDPTDPMPNPITEDSENSHGTSVAGLIGARANNAQCGVGAAHGAQLAGLKFIGAPTTTADTATVLSWQRDTIHQYNNSWGPSSLAPAASRLNILGGGNSPTVYAALLDNWTNGRGGRGNVYVWSAGNGRANGANVNYRGFHASRYTIPVAALLNTGIHTTYSTPGAAVFVSAPGGASGVPNTGNYITTTARTGAGNITGDTRCTNDFNGTSAAAPIVSGVVALMLGRNPNLTVRDVQHILANTAVRTDTGNSSWVLNGAGRYHSDDYGFGRVNAQAAVAAAGTWTNVSALQTAARGR